MNPRSLILSACLAMIAIASCTTTPAPPPGDPVVGKQVAQDMCASCHAVDATGASPNAASPPLRIVLRGYDAARLTADLEASKHIAFRRMPQFFFGGNHARDIVAYIETLNAGP